MQVVQTAGEPPNQGRMNFPMIGWTWKRRNALSVIAKAKWTPSQRSETGLGWGCVDWDMRGCNLLAGAFMEGSRSRLDANPKRTVRRGCRRGYFIHFADSGRSGGQPAGRPGQIRWPRAGMPSST